MGFVDTVKSAVTSFFGDVKPGDPPPWRKRLKKASYKSPSGQVVPFEFTDMEESVEKRTTVFESATGDGSYIQDNGRSSGRFPLTVFLSGGDYDLKAQAFISALLERGEGELTHPLYPQKIKVVPFGEIVRNDSLATSSGQAVFKVSFFETTGLQIGGGAGISQLYDSFLNASSVDFGDKINLSDAADSANFISKAKAVARQTERVMLKISDGQAALQQKIEGIGDSLNRGIDLLVGKPLMLARQTQIMIGEPARQVKSMKAKLDGYKNLADQIFTQTFDQQSHEKTTNKNNFHLYKLHGSTAVAAASLGAAAPSKLKVKKDNVFVSPVEGGEDSSSFMSRKDYIKTAEELKILLDEYQKWHDESYTAISTDDVLIDGGAVDTGDGLGELHTLVASAIATLVQTSFEAPTEFRIFLGAPRTPLDLSAEFYGSLEALDLFCSTNNLSGDEHLIIQRGRELVKYI